MRWLRSEIVRAYRTVQANRMLAICVLLINFWIIGNIIRIDQYSTINIPKSPSKIDQSDAGTYLHKDGHALFGLTRADVAVHADSMTVTWFEGDGTAGYSGEYKFGLSAWPITRRSLCYRIPTPPAGPAIFPGYGRMMDEGSISFSESGQMEVQNIRWEYTLMFYLIPFLEESESRAVYVKVP